MNTVSLTPDSFKATPTSKMLIGKMVLKPSEKCLNFVRRLTLGAETHCPIFCAVEMSSVGFLYEAVRDLKGLYDGHSDASVFFAGLLFETFLRLISVE